MSGNCLMYYTFIISLNPFNKSIFELSKEELLSPYYMWGTVLGAKNKIVKETHTNLCTHTVYVIRGQ